MPDRDRDKEVEDVSKETAAAVREWSFTLRGVAARMDALSRKLEAYPTLADALLKTRDELLPNPPKNGCSP